MTTNHRAILKKLSGLVVFLFLLILTSEGIAASQNFTAWLTDFRKEALRSGIKASIIEESLPLSMEPIEKVIELDRKQPESTMSFTRYRELIVNQNRINKGRDLLARYQTELRQASQRFGVQPQYIVALWGIETNYGANTGGFNVVNALATLAWDGRRANFFKKELVAALEILDQGHIKPSAMQGSWAGAMGQNQFMPSSFQAYAVDGNGDGRKDIWNDRADIFASTANYLAKQGWHEDRRWGREVKLPDGFNHDLIGLDIVKPLAAWQKLGLKTMSGQPVPVVQGMAGSLVAPDGEGGPVFLVYDNYRAIMHWNRSTYFATSVGLLADAIAR